MTHLKKFLIVTVCLTAIAVSVYRIYSQYLLQRLEEMHEQTPRPGPAAEGFNPIQVVPPFPAITNSPMLSASAVQDEVSDDELVIGVVVEGQARAYPINMLTGPAREIINDQIGDYPFAATW